MVVLPPGFDLPFRFHQRFEPVQVQTSVAYFTPSWTAISRQAGQASHVKVDTDFTASWTAISREAGQ
jgi:hypothetical protein